jgi:hypothetical protein
MNDERIWRRLVIKMLLFLINRLVWPSISDDEIRRDAKEYLEETK